MIHSLSVPDGGFRKGALFCLSVRQQERKIIGAPVSLGNRCSDRTRTRAAWELERCLRLEPLLIRRCARYREWLLGLLL